MSNTGETLRVAIFTQALCRTGTMNTSLTCSKAVLIVCGSGLNCSKPGGANFVCVLPFDIFNAAKVVSCNVQYTLMITDQFTTDL